MIKVERANLKNLNELALLFDKYRVFYNRASDIAAAKIFLRERMKRLWLLNDLFVDSNHRGKGISVALIDTANLVIGKQPRKMLQLLFTL